MKKRLSAIFAIIGLVVAAYSLWFYSSSADVNRNTYVESHSPVIGNTSAPVTIVEFFDPAGEACAAISPFVKSILAENPQDVRLVLRYAPFHGAASKEAIGVLEAAREQRMFDRVLIALFKEQSKWASNTASDSDLSKIWQIAVSAGLNEQRARDYLTENKFSNVISRDLKQIEELKITRTPTFYVNGEKLEQLEPDQFKQLVNKKIREAKS